MAEYYSTHFQIPGCRLGIWHPFWGVGLIVAAVTGVKILAHWLHSWDTFYNKEFVEAGGLRTT